MWERLFLIRKDFLSVWDVWLKLIKRRIDILLDMLFSQRLLTELSAP